SIQATSQKNLIYHNRCHYQGMPKRKSVITLGRENPIGYDVPPEFCFEVQVILVY
ncbi:hypothetical protein HAX54_005196, partial [Datura stramonium]|nr:hypothetical protein [Datura stramonium]